VEPYAAADVPPRPASDLPVLVPSAADACQLFSDLMSDVLKRYKEDIEALHSEIGSLKVSLQKQGAEPLQESYRAQIAALQCEICQLRHENVQLRKEFAEEFGVAEDSILSDEGYEVAKLLGESSEHARVAAAAATAAATSLPDEQALELLAPKSPEQLQAFEDLLAALKQAHTIVAEEALSHSSDPNLPALDPNFRSTADTWNRVRDKERVESELKLAEQGDETTLFVDPKDPYMIIARGYRRILYGDHGPYVEFAKHQVRWEAFPETWRKGSRSYYHEHFTATREVKAYEQRKTVADKPNPPSGRWSARNNRIHTGYADYQPGVVYMACDALMVLRCTTPCLELINVDVAQLFPESHLIADLARSFSPAPSPMADFLPDLRGESFDTTVSNMDFGRVESFDSAPELKSSKRDVEQLLDGNEHEGDGVANAKRQKVGVQESAGDVVLLDADTARPPLSIMEAEPSLFTKAMCKRAARPLSPSLAPVEEETSVPVESPALVEAPAVAETTDMPPEEEADSQNASPMDVGTPAEDVLPAETPETAAAPPEEALVSEKASPMEISTPAEEALGSEMASLLATPDEALVEETASPMVLETPAEEALGSEIASPLATPAEVAFGSETVSPMVVATPAEDDLAPSPPAAAEAAEATDAVDASDPATAEVVQAGNVSSLIVPEDALAPSPPAAAEAAEDESDVVAASLVLEGAVDAPPEVGTSEVTISSPVLATPAEDEAYPPLASSPAEMIGAPEAVAAETLASSLDVSTPCEDIVAGVATSPADSAPALELFPAADSEEVLYEEEAPAPAPAPAPVEESPAPVEPPPVFEEMVVDETATKPLAELPPAEPEEMAVDETAAELPAEMTPAEPEEMAVDEIAAEPLAELAVTHPEAAALSEELPAVDGVADAAEDMLVDDVATTPVEQSQTNEAETEDGAAPFTSEAFAPEAAEVLADQSPDGCTVE